MRALSLNISLPKVIAARALGRRGELLAVDGPLSSLSLTNVPEPPLPGKAWARIEVRSCGICGSDLSFVTYRSSPSLSPFGSFPCVLGHEILGTVVEIGPEITRVRVGDAVAIDPLIGCEVRDLPACRPCLAGTPALCERQIGGPIPGMLLGGTAALPGGFSERLVAHDSQLVRIPETLPTDVAAILEPLAVSVHAVLRRPPKPDERIVVIGGGIIGLATVATIRMLGFKNDIYALVRNARQAELAGSLGATRSFTTSGNELEEDLARSLDARLYKPLLGPRVSVAGVELCYDCAGNDESISLALRMARERGTIVMIGCAGEMRRLDLSHLWAKEIDFIGSLAYGTERWLDGKTIRTFELASELASASGLPLHRLVSERRPLSEYAASMKGNLDRSRTGIIKTLLLPNA